MFPKITDWPTFLVRVALICQLILQTLKENTPQRFLISVDEKPASRPCSDWSRRLPLPSGGSGNMSATTTLMAALKVANGKRCHQQLNPSRTPEDFCCFVQQTCQPFLADQLNTHLWESLVGWAAQQSGFTAALAKKGARGMRHNHQRRSQFLEEPTHRIGFVFTPEHGP